MANKSINRRHLIKALNKKVGLSHSDCSKVLEAMLSEITDCLVKGEPVRISSFATLKLRHKNGRRGRNPKTGEEAFVTPRRAVIFRPSLKLRHRVNQSGD